MKMKKTCALIAVLAVLGLVPLSYAPAAPMVPDKEPAEATETTRDSTDARPSDTDEPYGQDRRAACVSLPDGTVFGVVFTKTTDRDRQETLSTVQMFQRPEDDTFAKKMCRKLERSLERVKARTQYDEVRWFLVEY